MSLPFPEPGLRLIKQDDVETVNNQMTAFQEELAEAVDELDDHFETLKSAAQQRLGRLYNPTDYPLSLAGLFAISWEFPSVEPPNYLRQLNPELYEQECRRMTARFDEAIQLAEQAFMEELSQLVSHLAERLSGQTDGKPKVFRDTAVQNLSEFFTRFQRLNIRSNEQLDELVERAQRITAGVEPQQLRDNAATRNTVATQLAGVQSLLDGLLVDRPRRNIVRRPK